MRHLRAEVGPRLPERALVTCDLDGVLIDSRSQVIESWYRTCDEVGVWPGVDISSKIGLPLEEILRRETSFEADMIAEFCQLFRKFQDLNDHLEKCFSGSHEFLEQLRLDLDCDVGFYSARPPERLDAALEKLGQAAARRYSATLPNYPKPDPRGLVALERGFGHSFTCRLHIGDTGVDLEAAAGAGFSFLGVMWGYGDSRELGDIVASNMNSLYENVRAIISG